MQQHKTRQLILTALFAAIIYTGTLFFRIPVPPAMVHMGNALVVISFLALGTKWSMVAACVGFGLFDILNGWISSVHFTLLESIIVLLVLGTLYHALKYRDTITNVFILGATAGIVKIIVIFTRRVITEYLLVQNETALVIAYTKMTNTFITSAVTAIMVPILYMALKKYLPSLFTNRK